MFKIFSECPSRKGKKKKKRTISIFSQIIHIKRKKWKKLEKYIFKARNELEMNFFIKKVKILLLLGVQLHIHLQRSHQMSTSLLKSCLQFLKLALSSMIQKYQKFIILLTKEHLALAMD